ADQHIGAYSYTDRCTGGNAHIVALKRARLDIRGRCKHAPNQNTTLRVTDIYAEFRDFPSVMHHMTIILTKSAMQILGRPKHKSPSAGDVAGQHPDVDTLSGALGGNDKE